MAARETIAINNNAKRVIGGTIRSKVRAGRSLFHPLTAENNSAGDFVKISPMWPVLPTVALGLCTLSRGRKRTRHNCRGAEHWRMPRGREFKAKFQVLDDKSTGEVRRSNDISRQGHSAPNKLAGRAIAFRPSGRTQFFTR
jgi:hypothetical protein